MKNLIKSLVLLCLMFSLSTPAYAQVPPGGPNGAESKSELKGTRKQLATIIFSGLAGAILGLSTLSFYGRPQEHLSNIAVGFAVGTIAGTIYTTYKAANAPRDFYDYSLDENKSFDPFTNDRFQQHPEMQLAGYSWSF